MAGVARNWAGNVTYGARSIHRPTSVPDLRALVARSDRIRALGSRHSFTALPDSEGDLVELDGLPPEIEVDTDDRSVSVGAGCRYGEVAEHLHRAGWALANLASLPHISVAGAVMTGTHGSGDGNTTLSASVRALDVVGPDGDVTTLRRGDPGFDGSVVSFGVLGVVTRLVLDIEPTFEVTSTQFTGLDWETLDEHFDEITGRRLQREPVHPLGRPASTRPGSRAGGPPRSGSSSAPSPPARPCTCWPAPPPTR